jgi:inosine-uridine nucleoside N-ribohydrolase
VPNARARATAGPARDRVLLALLIAFGLLGCTTNPPTSSPGAPSPGAPSPASSGPGAGDERLRLVVDTDMAPDDVTAIASLIRDPAVELLAITVAGTGEAHCQGGMFVARSVVTQLGDDQVPVACGRGNPMGEAQPFPDAWRAGADAGNGLTLISPSFAPDPRSAEQVIVELANAEGASGGRLTILTLGTLTNIAAAIELDPTLPERVTLVSMLGAIEVPGNVTPDVAGGSGPAVAEWNAHADPTAVRLVLDAGFEWTLIPLDATNSVPLTEDLYMDLESDHAAGPADLIFELWSKNPYMRSSGFYLWDPLAAAAVRDPSIVETRQASIRVVEGAGLDGGRLIEDSAGAPVTIARSANREAFETFLLSRLRLGSPRDVTFAPVATLSVTVGDSACAARLDPPSPPAGLIRVEVTGPGSSYLAIEVFELGGMSWEEVEAFAADPPAPSSSASPPPINEVAWLESTGQGSGTGYGTTPPGLLGVACIAGTFEAPTATLAGPFEVGP